MNRVDFIEVLKDVLERVEADGCEGCAFIDRDEWENPCVKCRRNCKDYWRKSGCSDG